MTPQEWEAHVRSEAGRRCKAKHPDYYDSLICVGPGSEIGFCPPCHECLVETRRELEQENAQVERRTEEGE